MCLSNLEFTIRNCVYCYNLDVHVAEKVSDQNMPYFLTSSRSN